jgi:hypothetical protein
MLLNCILATNSPANCWGWVNDLGYNLSSDADAGCFTNGRSFIGIDAQLGPLAMNGGPTPTLALLSGSPAIDNGSTPAAPHIDQRGFPRPAGAAVDIGAFEFGARLPVLAISRSEASLDLTGTGNAGQSCRLLRSVDFIYWSPIATNQFGSDGLVHFHDNLDTGPIPRLYRLVEP